MAISGASGSITSSPAFTPTPGSGGTKSELAKEKRGRPQGNVAKEKPCPVINCEGKVAGKDGGTHVLARCSATETNKSVLWLVPAPPRKKRKTYISVQTNTNTGTSKVRTNTTETTESAEARA